MDPIRNNGGDRELHKKARSLIRLIISTWTTSSAAADRQQIYHRLEIILNCGPDDAGDVLVSRPMIIQ